MSHTCFVPLRKIKDYLLNPDHAAGRSKSVFCSAHGFNRMRCDELAAALADHFEAHGPSKEIATSYGSKLIVVGPLQTPDGRNPLVKSVWIASKAETIPTLVTAVPS